VQGESIKSVSIGTSTSDAAEQEPLTQTLTAHNPEPKDSPRIKDTKSAYRALREGGDPVVGGISLSEAGFPIRVKSFERRFRNRRGWITVMIVVLIIMIVVGIVAGNGVGKFKDSSKEGSRY